MTKAKDLKETKKRYAVLSAEGVDELEREVGIAIEAGFAAIGNFSYIPQMPGKANYFQAVQK